MSTSDNSGSGFGEPVIRVHGDVIEVETGNATRAKLIDNVTRVQTYVSVDENDVSGAGKAQPYRSMAERLADYADRRYKTDPYFRQHVACRDAATSW